MTKTERNKEYYARNKDKVRAQQYQYYWKRWKYLNAGVNPPDDGEDA